MPTPAVHRRSVFDRLRGINPLGPIVGKELRTMSRRKRSYLLRVGYLALLTLMLFWTWLTSSFMSYDQSVIQQAQRQAQLGQIFFIVFAMFSVIVMHLIGPVMTSSALGAERLGRTLHVLLMTPMTAWQIVSGKLFSRLLAAFTLIGLSLPVLAVVRLMGGIQTEDLFGALGLSAAVACSGAALGLLLSVWINRAYAVILLAYVIQGFFYGLLPLMLALSASILQENKPMSTTATWTLMELFAATNPIATMGFRLGGGPMGVGKVAWWPAIVTQVVAAGVLTLVAAQQLRRQTRREASANSSDAASIVLPPALPGIAPTSAMESAAPRPLARVLNPGRRARLVGENPVMWRELRRPLAARKWQGVLMIALAVALLLATYALFGANNILDDRGVHVGYACVFYTLLLLLACVLSATAASGEKESDTWTLLIASPLSGRQIVLGKLVGVLRRSYLPAALLIGHVFVFALFGVISWSAALVSAWVTLTFCSVFFATGLFLSIKFRRATAAVVANLLFAVLVYGGVPLLLAMVSELIPQHYFASGSSYYYRNLPEYSLYYMPWYFIGVGIDQLRDNGAVGWLNLPLSRESATAFQFMFLAFVSGAVQVVIGAAIVSYTAWRFDKIVGRSKQMNT